MFKTAQYSQVGCVKRTICRLDYSVIWANMHILGDSRPIRKILRALRSSAVNGIWGQSLNSD